MSKHDDGCRHYFLTLDELAELNKRLAGPQINRWKRSMTREQYLLARAEGRSLEDITLKHFNNDPKELHKQLREWGLGQEKEKKELKAMGKVAKPIELTREQYLQRRMAGEGRMRICRSLGVETKRFYDLLNKWGLRQLDVEERELELLALPQSEQPKPKVLDERVAEMLEEKTELRKPDSDTQKTMAAVAIWKDKAEQAEIELQNAKQESNDFAAGILERDRTISELKGQIKELEDRYQFDKERTLKLEEDVDRLVRNLEAEEQETKRLKEALKGTAVLASQAGARIKELEEERRLLLMTIEDASKESNVADYVTMLIPITIVTYPSKQRQDVYDSIEMFQAAVEAAGLDRELMVNEMFNLLERIVGFIASDLNELLPGQDVRQYVQAFFAEHNRRRIDKLPAEQQAG